MDPGPWTWHSCVLTEIPDIPGLHKLKQLCFISYSSFSWDFKALAKKSAWKKTGITVKTQWFELEMIAFFKNLCENTEIPDIPGHYKLKQLCFISYSSLSRDFKALAKKLAWKKLE